MFLGRKTPAEALSEAVAQDKATGAGQVCEANFYTAEFNRLQAHDDEALRLYRLAASTCPKGFIEQAGAIAALRALGKAL